MSSSVQPVTNSSSNRTEAARPVRPKPPVTKPSRNRSDREPGSRQHKKVQPSSSARKNDDSATHYAVSGAVNSKLQSSVYEVIQLNHGAGNHRHSTSPGASAINSNVVIAPCDKHPPEYFAQLLQEKQNQKSKLNQLWPKHWGCKNIVSSFSFDFFSLAVSKLHSLLSLFFFIFLT